MSEIKPSQFWIYKGTSNHCSQLEHDYETDTYEKSTPDGFYDYVCTKDTVQGGIHVLEAEPVLQMMKEMADYLREAQAKDRYMHNREDSRYDEILNSYKSFLSQIESEGK